MVSAQTRILKLERIPDKEHTYVVIMATHLGKCLWVMHRDRTSWEMPAGHIEVGEQPDHAALRELKEETGATRARLKGLCDYAVELEGNTGYGRFYLAEILEKEDTLHFETDRLLYSDELPDRLTYPAVQKALFHYGRKALLLQQRAKG
jgi:8-oxo-dGTP diphosphatase